MSITIYSSGGTLKYTLPAIQASRLHQSLNGECLFDFTMPGRMISGIAIGDQVRLGDLWFYVCRIGKQTLTAGAEYSVSCEHVSYSLADVEQEAAHFSGTPAAVLSTILSGTGFSAGTVTVSGDWSITINEATNKRDALQQWAAECGAEISYSGMSINFLSRVGSSVPVLLSDAENVKGLSVTLDSRSKTQTYAVELSRLQTVSLGDAVTIRYSTLDLDVTTRVITLDYDPFHPWLISMTTGDYVPNFTGAVSAALEARLKEGQPYYGVTIDKANGIKIERSDGLSEALFNSDLFTMRAKIDGVMKDRIYFDPVTGDYVFDGRLGADAVFTDALYADQGDIAELTVDRLSTSKKVRLYNLRNTGDDNFLHIQDNYQRLVTGSVKYDPEDPGVPLTEQATNRWGDPLWWQAVPDHINAQGYPEDADGNQIYATTEQPTPGEGETLDDYKVMVYQYTEQIKAQLAFELQDGVYIPKLILGAGDNLGRSKGFIFKDSASLLLRYLSSAGKNVDIVFSDDGFVDAMHRRLSAVGLDTDNQTIIYTVEGSNSYHTLAYAISGDTITFTWPDGHTCDINIPDDGGGGGGGGGPAPSGSLPAMDGVASAGEFTMYSRGDHVHPTDTSRQAVITASGVLKGNGSGGVSAAVAGTDYGTYSKPSGGIPASDLASGVIPSVPSASASNPAMDGTASPGSSGSWARGDHVHPTDTTRQALITASGILKGNGSGGVSAATAGTDYQAPLTFDTVPTASSNNPVISGGIYSYYKNHLNLYNQSTDVSAANTSIALSESMAGYSFLVVRGYAGGTAAQQRFTLTIPVLGLSETAWYPIATSAGAGGIRLSGSGTTLTFVGSTYTALTVYQVYGKR